MHAAISRRSCRLKASSTIRGLHYFPGNDEWRKGSHARESSKAAVERIKEAESCMQIGASEDHALATKEKRSLMLHDILKNDNLDAAMLFLPAVAKIVGQRQLNGSDEAVGETHLVYQLMDKCVEEGDPLDAFLMLSTAESLGHPAMKAQHLTIMSRVAEKIMASMDLYNMALVRDFHSEANKLFERKRSKAAKSSREWFENRSPVCPAAEEEVVSFILEQRRLWRDARPSEILASKYGNLSPTSSDSQEIRQAFFGSTKVSQQGLYLDIKCAQDICRVFMDIYKDDHETLHEGVYPIAVAMSFTPTPGYNLLQLLFLQREGDKGLSDLIFPWMSEVKVPDRFACIPWGMHVSQFLVLHRYKTMFETLKAGASFENDLMYAEKRFPELYTKTSAAKFNLNMDERIAIEQGSFEGFVGYIQRSYKFACASDLTLPSACYPLLLDEEAHVRRFEIRCAEKTLGFAERLLNMQNIFPRFSADVNEGLPAVQDLEGVLQDVDSEALKAVWFMTPCSIDSPQATMTLLLSNRWITLNEIVQKGGSGSCGANASDKIEEEHEELSRESESPRELSSFGDDIFENRRKEYEYQKLFLEALEAEEEFYYENVLFHDLFEVNRDLMLELDAEISAKAERREEEMDHKPSTDNSETDQADHEPFDDLAALNSSMSRFMTPLVFPSYPIVEKRKERRRKLKKDTSPNSPEERE